MCVAICDGVDFRFSIVIFPKDYEALGNLLQDHLIAVVEGNLKCNPDNGEISVIAQSLKTFNISTLRAQAKEMNLFDPKFTIRKKATATKDSLAKNAETPAVSPFVLDIPK